MANTNRFDFYCRLEPPRALTGPATGGFNYFRRSEPAAEQTLANRIVDAAIGTVTVSLIGVTPASDIGTVTIVVDATATGIAVGDFATFSSPVAQTIRTVQHRDGVTAVYSFPAPGSAYVAGSQEEEWILLSLAADFGLTAS